MTSMHCRARRRRAARTAGRLVVPALVVTLLATGCGGGSKPQQPVAGSHTDGLLDIRPVSFESSVDGKHVTGLVGTPRGVRSRGCVIWQYDAGSRKEDSVQAWQGLALLGLSGFSIDFRARGGHADDSKDAKAALARPATFAKLVRGTVGDLRSALDYLEKQPYCAKNIAYVGVGLGGAVGTILAAEDKRVEAVGLVSTPGTWNGVDGVAKGVPSLDPARYVGKIAPRPVLILSGDQDATVAPANARRLQAAAREPKTVVDFHGGHDPATGPDAADNANSVLSFLLRRVSEPTYGVYGRLNGTFFSRQ
jgi:fermentation-respiration switch protein FrsA (DUF1100 family)